MMPLNEEGVAMVEPLDPSTLKPGQVVYDQVDFNGETVEPGEDLDTAGVVIRRAGVLYFVDLDSQHSPQMFSDHSLPRIMVIPLSHRALYASLEDAVRAAIEDEAAYIEHTRSVVESARRWLADRGPSHP
jgi:hypothetical protein